MTHSPNQFLDLTQAQDIAGEGDQLRELVATFEASLSEEITKVSDALANKDAHLVEFGLHTLKGFMSIFVTPELAHQFTLLHNMSRDQPLSVTEASFNALVPSFRILLTEVRAWLSL